MTDMNQTPNNEEELIEDVVELADDEGNIHAYDLVARIDRDEDEYVVLVPQDEDDDEIVILKSILVDDETEELVFEDNEEILTSVFEEFKELFAEEFDFVDGDDDDDAIFTDAE